jgi:lipoprotein-releasing system permease protein
MFTKLEKLIALRFFFSKRKEKFISINTAFAFTGIMLGVATLIIVMSIMNGFRVELVKRILGINSHLTIYDRTNNFSDYADLLNKIKNLNEVKTANIIIDLYGMVTTANKANAANVKGITKADLLEKLIIKENIIMGDIANFNEHNSVIIGSNMSYEMNLVVGDKITLIAPETNKTVIGAIPKLKEYQIVGIFNIGMYEYDAKTIFIPFETAQIQFGYKNKISALEIYTHNANNIVNIKKELNEIIASSENLSIHDWQNINSSFINALRVERNVMFIILMLIIIVAAFNIISSLIMLVEDKIKHIAILQTFGMSKSGITKIFFINGALIGIFGTLIGAIIGISFAYNINSIKLALESLTGTKLFDPIIYFLTDLPSEISAFTTIMVILSSLIICFLAAIYPARKAASIEPAEILRHE